MAQNNPANILISIEQILVALQQLGLALASNPGDGTPFVILLTAGPATNVMTASSNLPASGSVPPATSPIANIPAASPGISGGGAVVAPIAAAASPAVSDTTTFKGKAPAAAPSCISTSTSTAVDAASSTVAPAAISAVAPAAVASTVAPVTIAPAADAWNNVQPLVSGVSGFYCKRFVSYEAATIAFAEADSLGLVEIKN
ncbi:hypothetical protein H0H81_003196 [Sphagnurus paluster]|uniref:Uncharacterized protein n=1 Tax=Sphagnurus paluster TaxID=117069 RepID=A0A9P7K2N7_9AGAR|nr:hypothetical protein H0H81_003196 [Sphagnurus paluster]